ncbi:MAG TPA: radical SAM protein, partial [bacterium]|nr:radical SAM protein [bacterium]
MKQSNSIRVAGYPYTGIIDWDVETINKIIKQVNNFDCLPKFGLKRVEIHPTSLCQYNCPFCYGVNFKKKQKNDLPLKFIEQNILKSIKNSKLNKDDPIIILAGLYSEPLAHAERMELIKLLGKYNFRFGIYTNGGFLNEELSRAICESAKQNRGGRKSYISLNVIGAIENGDFNSLEKKIKYFVKFRDSINAPIQINVPILVNGNISAVKLRKLQDKLLEIGINKIRYSMPQVPILKNLISKPALDNIKLIESLKKYNMNNVFVRSISGKQFDRCYVMANTVFIDNKGLVYPCSQINNLIQFV